MLSIRAILSIMLVALLSPTLGFVWSEPLNEDLSSASAVYPFETLESPGRGVRTYRTSSSDPDWPDGNNDCKWIGAGEERTLADLQGPGRITHLWFTVSPGSGHRRFMQDLVLRVYYDGDTHPCVQVPLGDFFAVGHGLLKDLDSALVSRSSRGRSLNCYWPMPFRKSARVTLASESETHGATVYWFVDWEQRPVPADIPYFHALYRQEYPAQPGDYLILDTTGQGHYVGTILSVQMGQDSWFGEGDDRFFVDGETTPSLSGTGTEDYFGDAWGFREFNRLYHGVSLWEGYARGDRCTAYRWHVRDPIYFNQSLKAVIEHKGFTFDSEGNFIGKHTEDRYDNYSSVACWYQLPPSPQKKPWPTPPSQLPEYISFEAEQLVAPERLESPTLEIEHRDWPACGGDHLLVVKTTRPGQSVDLSFEIAEASDYLLYIRHLVRGDGGVFDFYLDDQVLDSGVNFSCPDEILCETKLGGQVRLEAGTHRFRVVGSPGQSQTQPNVLYLDTLFLDLRPEYQPPAAEGDE